MINNSHKEDELIRKMVRLRGIDKPSPGFADKVMNAVNQKHEDIFDRLLEPRVWIYFAAGIAAITALVLWVDIPVITDIFSPTGFRNLGSLRSYANIITSLGDIISGIKFNTTTLIILGTAASLLVFDRIIRWRQRKSLLICCIGL